MLIFKGVKQCQLRQKEYQRHQCRDFRKKFTVLIGTIFEGPHIPLQKWLFAIYLIETGRKGISSLQLSKEIGITQKSAWYLGMMIREFNDGNNTRLSGTVEIDETYIGGLEKNKHSNKKTKSAVVGM